ncbi:ANTAR domain-containing protein [Pusillimonas sp. CC-YST705]|uniref:ANTAR domain-containing protein n=1 Tax=Mesopusillimonas faecipullorum TaxID=2755040 RepID=A0ABS8C9U1_9BURK|nr:ANTAR domain-containing protein [Mesopusillimonas faecipullorum]MCB5362790.1 ANTAR domain-containing protein [Mesopusillimonas faecipullorum]
MMAFDELAAGCSAPRLLHDLRRLRVAVFHPQDRDSEELLLQLRRIGCQVQAFWPPSMTLPDSVDLVFLAVHPNVELPDWAKQREPGGPVIIAVVMYENPTIIEAVLTLGVESVITSPVKAFGLLATIVVARQIKHQRTLLLKQNQKLENKLSGMRQVLEAKMILMDAKRISEEEAYKLMREQAMVRRVTVEQIARTIVDVHKILPLNSG